ncbi:hypothetical protein [Kribbella sp. CA-293567]|uniref:hypothetical protein n=1 Tax=Kribbella sp. CA-293567 TaxID=3002436 RepID=UPI0022DDC2F9|nr:hypothetical protein [Kribbella sp. CA-293567]WBQ03568.1 hypothetical protein OX958_26790 [Kribbella sp. CA-293567]
MVGDTAATETAVTDEATSDALGAGVVVAEAAPTEAGGPAPADFRWVGAMLAALMAVGLAMNEVSLLAAGFLAEGGSSWSFSGMSGPLAAQEYGGWHAKLTGEQLADWLPLLTIFLILDFVFIALYVPALRRFVPTTPVLLLAGLDVVENLGTHLLGRQRCGGGDCVAHSQVIGLTVVTMLKWVAFASVLVLLFSYHWPTIKAAVPRIRRALWIQRFSMLAFLPLALLTVVPGTDVLDQLPDVQRRWLDDGTGIWHAIAAALLYYAVLLPVVFLLGRIRSDWAVRRVRGDSYGWPFYASDGEPRRQNLKLWLVGPVLMPLVALLIAVSGQGEVFKRRLFVFCLIPLLVLGLSRLLRGKPDVQPKELRKVGPWFPRDVMIAGDMLAVTAVSLGGLGMVRAFTGLAAGDAVGLFDSSYVVHPTIAVLIGVALGVGVWLASWPVLTAIQRWGRPEATGLLGWYGHLASPGVNRDGQTTVVTPPRSKVRAGFVLGASAGILLLGSFPRRIAEVLGVLGATMLALTTLVVLAGVVVAYAQERQPPEIFQTSRLRLRATPVIGLLLLAMLLTSLIGDKTEVHPLTAGPAPALPDRPQLREAFDAWEAQATRCTVPLDGGLSLRPMIMVAAEGGGIRATYWTTSALQRISTAGNGCAKHSVLFSGGASGGAFGLTLARFTDEPLAAVKAIAGHEALGAATISTLSSDLLASVAGLRFDAAAEYRTPARQPLDRAGLMETAWERQVPALRTLFLPADGKAENAMTGQLILTTTAVRDGCRALVSQVDLSEGARAADGSPVCGAGVAGAHNYDLFGAFGCSGNVPALTAGLLASRFPYVTPSGVVDRCGDLKAAQLVDGGYTDNTGVGTIVDLAPLWGPAVREHNDKVLAAGTGEVLVPLVVYIENGTGKDYSVGNDDPVDGIGNTFTPGTNLPAVPELLVPPLTKLVSAKEDGTNDRALLREARAAAVGQLCSTSTACAELRGKLPNPVYVISQSTQPSLSAPLGWTLSRSSQHDLDNDLLLQADKQCAPDCRGYGTLHDLLAALGQGT